MKKTSTRALGTLRAARSEGAIRLILHRETLRGLDRAALERVAGGTTYRCHSGGYVSACSDC
jgi:hypothetical protein